MATWRDFKAYVKSGYHVTREKPDTLQLKFRTETGRSQTVYLSHRPLKRGQEGWLIIESPFADLDRLDGAAYQKVLEEAGQLVCGGVVIVGELLVYRHAVPLVNLDANEFQWPLQIVTVSADRLEQMVSASDTY